jgi:hypothetical protein
MSDGAEQPPAAQARLWGGRQGGALVPAFEAFNRSLPFDRRHVVEDLEGSAAGHDQDFGFFGWPSWLLIRFYRRVILVNTF